MTGFSLAPGQKAYVAEGLGDIDDWDAVLQYQSKNGSLFNSPSATSALAIHSRDTNALKYLDLLAKNCPSSGLHRQPLPSTKLSDNNIFVCNAICYFQYRWRTQ
jgi:ent-kaurene synthase